MIKKTSFLETMAVDHPYYCASGNFYSNEPNQHYRTMTEFLAEHKEMDTDLNLVFRWDVHLLDNGDYSCDVYIMLQRKGIFVPTHIESITEAEAQQFCEYLKSHWERLQEMWRPISVE